MSDLDINKMTHTECSDFLNKYDDDTITYTHKLSYTYWHDCGCSGCKPYKVKLYFPNKEEYEIGVKVYRRLVDTDYGDGRYWD